MRLCYAKSYDWTVLNKEHNQDFQGGGGMAENILTHLR